MSNLKNLYSGSKISMLKEIIGVQCEHCRQGLIGRDIHLNGKKCTAAKIRGHYKYWDNIKEK